MDRKIIPQCFCLIHPALLFRKENALWANSSCLSSHFWTTKTHPDSISYDPRLKWSNTTPENQNERKQRVKKGKEKSWSGEESICSSQELVHANARLRKNSTDGKFLIASVNSYSLTFQVLYMAFNPKNSVCLTLNLLLYLWCICCENGPFKFHWKDMK